jgi:hypothetical protein
MEVSLGSSEPAGAVAEPEQEGGGGGRRRRGAGRRRTQRGGAGTSESGDGSVAVEKMQPGSAAPAAMSVSVAVKAPVAAPAAAPAAPTPVMQTPPAKVVIAPPKKRPAKLVLVPGQRPTPLAARTAALQKTFKAHKVRVLIDNTAKTQRRRRQTLQAVDAMTSDQLRAAAVGARLSRRETVEKVPIDLLRQMLKDYRMMRGMLV